MFFSFSIGLQLHCYIVNVSPAVLYLLNQYQEKNTPNTLLYPVHINVYRTPPIVDRIMTFLFIEPLQNLKVSLYIQIRTIFMVYWV